MTTNDTYVLEWSHSSSQFHIQRLSDLVSANRLAYRDNRPRADYHVLHVGTLKECSDMADACRQTVDTRRQAMHAIQAAQGKRAVL